MATEQTPAQRMAEIEEELRSGDAVISNPSGRWLLARCRKLEASLKVIVTAVGADDMRSIISAARGVLRERGRGD